MRRTHQAAPSPEYVVIEERHGGGHRLAVILAVSGILALTVSITLGLVVFVIGLVVGTRTGRRILELLAVAEAVKWMYHRTRSH